MFSKALTSRRRFFDARLQLGAFRDPLRQLRVQLRDALDVTAKQDAVIAGHQRAFGDRLVRAEVGDGVHLHVVADGEAVEAENLAKDPVRDTAAERGRYARSIESRIRS